MAIYVGKLKGKHYVIENAGQPPKSKGAEGPWLQLRGGNSPLLIKDILLQRKRNVSDIKTAFGDLKFQDSRFKIIKPAKSHDSAQRAMAAYFLKFQYKVQTKMKLSSIGKQLQFFCPVWHVRLQLRVLHQRLR